MEDKSYSWLLSELSTSKSVLKILETGICRGSKLLNWFSTDNAGIVINRPLKENSRTKFLLNYFLNQRVPILEEYNPDKVICYLYHRKGRKIVTAKDTVELAENQLHGLQVRSIHMALPSSTNYYIVYRVNAWSENNELQTDVTYGKFSKDAFEIIKDPVASDKAITIAAYIIDLLLKHYMKSTKSIKIDLIPDVSGQMHILKIKELLLIDANAVPSMFPKGFVRSGTLRAYELSSEEISIEDNDSDRPPIRMLLEKEQKKKETSNKIHLKKNTAENSVVFLEMLANTIDKERKLRENQEILTNKRKALNNRESLDQRKIFQLRSLKSNRDSFTKRAGINSINDLLFYVEKTRPRIWVKDTKEDDTPATALQFPSSLKEHNQALNKKLEMIASHKKGSSINLSTTKNLYQKKFFEFLNEEEHRLKLKLPESTINTNTPIAAGTRKNSLKKKIDSSHNLRIKTKNSTKRITKNILKNIPSPLNILK